MSRHGGDCQLECVLTVRMSEMGNRVIEVPELCLEITECQIKEQGIWIRDQFLIRDYSVMRKKTRSSIWRCVKSRARQQMKCISSWLPYWTLLIGQTVPSQSLPRLPDVEQLCHMEFWMTEKPTLSAWQSATECIPRDNYERTEQAVLV